MDLRQPLERAGPVEDALEDDRGEVGAPDGAGRYERRAEDRPSRPERERRREDDPRETRVADDARSDEDGVEGTDAVLRDPDDDVRVEIYVRSSCFVSASSCSGSNGLPMNASAPRSRAWATSSSSSFPLNMTTGIDSTP